ncbi:hypothetical protein GFB49_14845 [Epibacterium sp. SM1979]|uniref:UPF0102 protein GFB49_14845 n=1 Tax=Tritonibacter litoralis TaxID=2662264 RepID=A0A843YKK1_9RHOB|nr:YraN family protein [Tritonibacter litoralis]MQQ09743.1 hypothetical protein [Tritonibacter litoralis]
MARNPRQTTGQRAYLAGASAEQAVLRAYAARGMIVEAQRWRGAGGEIDLILRAGAQLVFVEVKHSQTHAQAASHLSHAQQTRIYRAAEAFLAEHPELHHCDMRFDAALVDGQGQIEILENAFGLG